MKSPILILSFLLFSAIVLAQSPKLDFNTVFFEVEENPSLEIKAKALAIDQRKPVSIYIENTALIEAKAIENGEPVYMVISNFLNPIENGELQFYAEVSANFNLADAHINFGNGNFSSPTSGKARTTPNPDPNIGVLLIPESSNDRIMAFNRQTGDLINADFIPMDPTNLSTPIAAIPNATKTGNIFVSDQLEDVVLKYDKNGALRGIHAPNNMVNTAILDNIRGIEIKNGTTQNLLVTIADNTNADAIAEFDAAGNFIGNFINNGAGGLDSPFDILFHEKRNIYLISAITSDAIHTYDINGNFLNIFATVDGFPEQLTELANGNVLVANFNGTQEGILEYDEDGNFIGSYDPPGLGGYRGVYELGNGNLLITNGAGVHEITRAGTLVETKISGVSSRFIHEWDFPIVEPMIPTMNQWGLFIFSLVLLNISLILLRRKAVIQSI